MHRYSFSVLAGTWAIARLPPAAAIPPWALTGSAFVSITRTAEELSVACEESAMPLEVQGERGWSALKIQGPLPFNETGVLASFAMPLAAAHIAILAISTFDTDYILVRTAELSAACRCLEGAGHEACGSEQHEG